MKDSVHAGDDGRERAPEDVKRAPHIGVGDISHGHRWKSAVGLEEGHVEVVGVGGVARSQQRSLDMTRRRLPLISRGGSGPFRAPG